MTNHLMKRVAYLLNPARHGGLTKNTPYFFMHLRHLGCAHTCVGELSEIVMVELHQTVLAATPETPQAIMAPPGASLGRQEFP